MWNFCNAFLPRARCRNTKKCISLLVILSIGTVSAEEDYPFKDGVLNLNIGKSKIKIECAENAVLNEYTHEEGEYSAGP